jgi:integrase
VKVPIDILVRKRDAASTHKDLCVLGCSIRPVDANDLDLKVGRLRVANTLVEVAGQRYEGPPKTKAGGRSMTLPSSVVADLRLHVARYGDSQYVFSTTSGKTWSAEDWRCRIWRPVVTQSGLAPLRPHDLKHTGVALLAAAGVDPSRSRDELVIQAFRSRTTATAISSPRWIAGAHASSTLFGR